MKTPEKRPHKRRRYQTRDERVQPKKVVILPVAASDFIKPLTREQLMGRRA